MLTTVVIFVFCLLYTAAIAAQTKSAPSGVKSADSVTGALVLDPRSRVREFGFGKRVDVKLKNGSKASGRITGLAGDQFVVTDEKGNATAVAYSGVARITIQKEKLGFFHHPWKGIMFTAAGVGTLIVITLAWLD